MKLCLRNVWLIGLILSASGIIHAQSSTVENLRSQLGDVQKKEAELQERIKQLDKDLKPENIEHSLAPFGSTRPEELREQRRRQLENEKKTVQSQLDQLAASRIRLEKAISTAEAAVYDQSANMDASDPLAVVGSESKAVEPKKNQRRPRQRRAKRTKRRG